MKRNLSLGELGLMKGEFYTRFANRIPPRKELVEEPYIIIRSWVGEPTAIENVKTQLKREIKNARITALPGRVE